MAASERDETPMLPVTYVPSDEQNGSSRGRTTRTRSASMSIPRNSLDSSEYEPNLVGFTGPLRTERRASVIQMSGPMYSNRNQEFIFQPPQKTSEPKVERYPSSIDRTKNDEWALDDYTGKNEHLLRSGQLGMCNDPYCTTCPMYYSVKGRTRPSRKSEIIDAKVLSLCHLFS